MIDIKLVVILANKKMGVVNPLTYYPREYEPGHPLPERVWSSRVVTKELGERDFSDKFLIYSECISKFKEIYRPFTRFRLDKLEFVSRPFSDGEFRGVAVVVLEHVSAVAITWQKLEDLASRKTLKNVEVPTYLWDVEQDEVHQKIHLKQKVLEAKTLPKIPEDTGADIREATIRSTVPTNLSPDERERLILAIYLPYAKEDPNRAGQFSQRLGQIAEAQVPPEHRRTLGLREAARRISDRGIRIDHTQLGRFFAQGRISIGALGPDGELRFSPAECDSFVPPPRLKPGPKAEE